ncbi:uncharacterized protein LOC111702633 isoform X2 [Eurytemora carolleeae]|uniref:uncharacterized protein LOC111702633 isoform X2 n=1 Tax=Eurytemora carolleeae TaxID=1294199 RepID=UPI000C7920C9|nr:uncharacterized protein LOC111702633 isoform X2 [Eurytemora carolleeae]|eukprot:XP_023330155.1 uncharacterized protein LOC111702633 isoform X2 [Eurytemora affinis]
MLKTESFFTFVLILLQMGLSAGQTESCLQCGADCLSAVQSAVPVCISAGFDFTTALVGCVERLLSLAQNCQSCIKSLVCCVTDSCSICNCECKNLIKFTAPVFSPLHQEQSWLFNEECHFAYIGAPNCLDCDGKNVYESVNCSQSLYLHYHDYIIDGRWVLTEGLDDDDTNALLRNKGDGLDDEECPEKETYTWETRSQKAPGWFSDKDIKLEPFQTQEKIVESAKLISNKKIIKLD